MVLRREREAEIKSRHKEIYRSIFQRYVTQKYGPATAHGMSQRRSIESAPTFTCQCNAVGWRLNADSTVQHQDPKAVPNGVAEDGGHPCFGQVRHLVSMVNCMGT